MGFLLLAGLIWQQRDPSRCSGNTLSPPPPYSTQGRKCLSQRFYGNAATIFGWFDLQMERCFAIAQHDVDMWSSVILLLAGVIYLWESLARLGMTDSSGKWIVLFCMHIHGEG